MKKDIRDNPEYKKLKADFLSFEISADDALDKLSAMWAVDPWYILSEWLDEM